MFKLIIYVLLISKISSNPERFLKSSKRTSYSSELEKLAEMYRMNKGNADDFDENETIPIKKY